MTALSYRPERQERLTILRRIEPRFSHRGMLQLRNQKMKPRAPTGHTE